MNIQENQHVFQSPRDWEKVYSADPEHYFFGESPSQIAQSALSFFLKFGGNSRQAHALDLGCGEGRDTVYFAKHGMQVTARDISTTGIQKMRALFTHNGLNNNLLDAEVVDVRDFNYPKENFDLTLAANLFQFLAPEIAIKQISLLQEATKPGGICAIGIFSSVMRDWGADLEGLFSLSPDELMDYFISSSCWQLLDRTEYWTYRPDQDAMAAFTYVVARKKLS